MASLGSATHASLPSVHTVGTYTPYPSSAGGSVDPLRFLNVGGVATPIQ